MKVAGLPAIPSRCWGLAGPRPVVAARRIVGRECRRLGLAEVLVDDAVLAVDELATNAVLHGAAPYELRLYTEPAGWGVVNHADGITVIQARLSRAGDVLVVEEFPPSEAGRGLLLVGGLYPGTCCVRAVVGQCGRPAKEVAFTLPEAAVAKMDAEERPGAAPPLAGTGQRGR